MYLISEILGCLKRDCSDDYIVKDKKSFETPPDS